MSTKPYVQKLAELVADLTEAADDAGHPLMMTHHEVQRSALVVITSTRGFCGGYNGNVLRAAMAHLDEEAKSGLSIDTYMTGKKGIR